MRKRAASEQAEARWMRIHAAFSITRAPILSSLWRRGDLSDAGLGPAGGGNITTRFRLSPNTGENRLAVV